MILDYLQGIPIYVFIRLLFFYYSY